MTCGSSMYEFRSEHTQSSAGRSKGLASPDTSTRFVVPMYQRESDEQPSAMLNILHSPERLPVL